MRRLPHCAVLAACLALAGCGGGKEDPAAAASPGPAAMVPATPWPGLRFGTDSTGCDAGIRSLQDDERTRESRA